MIQLTRLNKKPLIVNADLIEFIENAPDTVITLVTGEKVIVLESSEAVLDLIYQYRRRLIPVAQPNLLPLLALQEKSEDPGEQT